MKSIYITFLALLMTILTFAQNKTDIKCKIWKPNSFCEIADTIHLGDRVFGIHSDWTEEKCEKMDSMKNLIGVWLTFYNKKGCTLHFKTNFENFHLIKKGTEQKIGLFAIYSSEKHYITAIKAKIYNYHINGGQIVNMIMLFPQAEKGDKIIIDNFIEAEIQ